ncbi:hypothetical protein D1007_28304 [Hordeum vulgare]|nr:hypothetical protein D1007_28304 [Hordeum vulgare]
MEPSGSKSSANSTTRAGGSEVMDDLIGKLNLNEREEDDLNFDEEFPDEGYAAEFMAIARVHTNKPFSRGAFYENMRMAWSLAQGVTFSALGENLFSITVDCMGDWKRLTEEGPWLFRDHAVLIESYDGFTKFDEIILDQLEFCPREANMVADTLARNAVTTRTSKWFEEPRVSLSMY